jgi:hypothetical protein
MMDVSIFFHNPRRFCHSSYNLVTKKWKHLSGSISLLRLCHVGVDIHHLCECFTIDTISKQLQADWSQSRSWSSVCSIPGLSFILPYRYHTYLDEPDLRWAVGIEGVGILLMNGLTSASIYIYSPEYDQWRVLDWSLPICNYYNPTTTQSNFAILSDFLLILRLILSLCWPSPFWLAWSAGSVTFTWMNELLVMTCQEYSRPKANAIRMWTLNIMSLIDINKSTNNNSSGSMSRSNDKGMRPFDRLPKRVKSGQWEQIPFPFSPTASLASVAGII